jgi:2-polyprenyl-3-methyl-5-hydroxy-6-metoxy-1,4-benzoquinol methylase
MENTFSKIYQKNIWGNGSGLGSSLNYNTAYIDFLQELMKEANIKNVLDIGCGDWQFSQHIDWSDIQYTGIDCVKAVIDTNNSKFGSSNIRFLHIDPTVEGDYTLVYDELPKNCDLVILKDVLQHWSNESIIKFMDKLINQGHKHILIVNNFKNAEGENRNINNRYHYAKLDAMKYPLNKYKPYVLGYYKFKQVAMIDNLNIDSSLLVTDFDIEMHTGNNKKSRRIVKKNRKSIRRY